MKNFIRLIYFVLFMLVTVGCAQPSKHPQKPDKKVNVHKTKPEAEIPSIYWSLVNQQGNLENGMGELESELSITAKTISEITNKLTRSELSMVTLAEDSRKERLTKDLSKIQELHIELTEDIKDLSNRLPSLNEEVRKSIGLLNGVRNRTQSPKRVLERFVQIEALLSSYRKRGRKVSDTASMVNQNLDTLIAKTGFRSNGSTFTKNLKNVERRQNAITIAYQELDQELSLVQSEFSDVELCWKSLPKAKSKESEVYHKQQITELVAQQAELDLKISESGNRIQFLAQKFRENTGSPDSHLLTAMVSVLRSIKEMEESIVSQQGQLLKFKASFAEFSQTFSNFSIISDSKVQWIIDRTPSAKSTFEEAKKACHDRGFHMLTPNFFKLFSENILVLDTVIGWEWFSEVNKDEVTIVLWDKIKSKLKVIYKNGEGAFSGLPFRCGIKVGVLNENRCRNF